MTDVLEELAKVLEQRKKQAPESSYVATLYAKGTDAILKKIGEESSEVIIAAKAGDNQALTHEVADLWFHTLVLLAHAGLSPGDIMTELQRRFGQSGLEEKARRGQ